MPDLETEKLGAVVPTIPPTTYDKKTFHRKFETSHGYLKPSDFPPIDWAEKEQLEMLFPAYKRELLALGNKKVSKLIDIEDFDLKTPNNSRYIFQDCRLLIEPTKRCAMYGTNGSGKTTLMEAISSGIVKNFPKWMHVHHMKELEHNKEAEKLSVIDTVICAHPMRRVLVAMEPWLEKLLAAEQDEARAEKLKANLEYVQFEMRKISAGTGEKRAREMLRVLGFDETGEKAPVSSLSGGLRMRVALAAAFFIDPQLLLLDEPTNHLDMPSVLWLENRLRGYKGAYLLVTHDRTLLENVVTSVMLLQEDEIKYFSMGFKEFEKKKEKLDKEREQMIDKFLLRNRNIDPSTPLYRKKLRYQEWQQKRLARQVLLAGKFTFKEPSPLKCDKGVEQKDISLIKIDNVRFSYGPDKGLPYIFDNPISYEVKVGTRVGIMGPNGAGKSTFLKLITGKLTPTEGKITTNPDYTLAYFGQHSTKELKLELTPLEFMQASFPKAKEGNLKKHLQKTSVSDDVANTRIKNLSFSQRSCVIFAKLTFIPPHLLIMDEPTNFLDLDSVDSLIKAANKFKGGLITVTHNRDFLKRCSKHFLSIIPGAFLEFDTMRSAERATYSFISALEKGEAIDVKNAILNNRGGGSVHSEEYLQKKEAQRKAMAAADQAKLDAEAAEAALKAKLEAEKEARRQAKLALIKTDWKVDEVCWAPASGGKGGPTYVKGKVLRVIPNMGISVELVTGKRMMVPPKKLRLKNPDVALGNNNGGRNNGGRNGGGRGRGGRGRNGGGRGRGGRGRNGGGRGRNGGGRGRNGGGRGRGGGRGGRGGRGRNNGGGRRYVPGAGPRQ